MLYLASRSPRRKLLLGRILPEFELLDIRVDEEPEQGEVPVDYVLRVARDKALEAQRKLSGDFFVLAADTEVILNGAIIGKPRDLNEAMTVLKQLSGVTHEVVTSVVVLGDKLNQVVNQSRVCFRDITEQECRWYSENFRPLDKAGAYGIQDAAAAFIDRFEGSYSGVMGLPLHDTRELLIKSGVILN